MSEASTSDPVARPPLGATLTDRGCDFAVVSLVAESVEVCLFDPDGEETTRVTLEPGEGGIWQGSADAVAGQRYGYRVHGTFDPERGLWCDPARLLIDPYARAISDSTSVVVDGAFDWEGDDERRPRHAWEDSVIYEVHVKGATMRHPAVPASVRGTYAGLAAPAMLAHLVDLGVTAVELLPVHEIVDEGFLAGRGLTNYWGYNSIGYFAPTARYAARHRGGAQVAEFKAMVAALHRAGLEVLLDVVYNHTAESDERGPVLSFRGLDNEAYYRHDDAHHLVDTTGCGNSINAASPIALGLVLDSLRYWAEVCHVDGFRFDLAPTLARPDGRFDPAAPFLQLCLQDPVLRGVKLIAEPWDVGEDDSFALGRFPAPFREWNGRFRDTVRDFWRSTPGTLADFATRVAGSSDLFSEPGRTPTASINLVTSHDGFTLRDLVSFDDKHNEANGESNEDGADDNRSWNCGVEGETDDPAILSLRASQSRALLSTLVLSSGVPMLVAGDEFGRTQQGNNNAYCQDSEMSWLDWDGADVDLLDFTRRLLAVRQEHRAFRRRTYLAGRAFEELGWHTPGGRPMEPHDWEDPETRCVAIVFEGTTAAHGETGFGDDFVLLVNGWWESVDFAIPDAGHDAFRVELDSHDPDRTLTVAAHGSVTVAPRSLVVLRAEAVANTAHTGPRG